MKEKIKISQIVSNNNITKLYFQYVMLISDCLEKLSSQIDNFLELQNLNGIISFSLNISNIFVWRCSWLEEKCSKWCSKPHRYSIFGLYWSFKLLIWLTCFINDFIAEICSRNYQNLIWTTQVKKTNTRNQYILLHRTQRLHCIYAVDASSMPLFNSSFVVSFLLIRNQFQM